MTKTRSALLAIDPGPERSGWVLFDGKAVLESGTDPNEDVLTRAAEHLGDIAIEMVAHYGMAVGADVFETVRWIGRFQQASLAPEDVMLIFRREVKLHLCDSVRAKDANIRQALIDLLGAPGTKKNPGPTYGVTGHVWSALAVAVTAYFQPRRKK